MLTEIIMQHPIFFLLPVVIIIVGIYLVFLHRRRCALCGSFVRPFWKECSCASEPPTVFSQGPEEEQENEVVADMRPFSYGEKSEEKREMGFTAKVTTFSYDDAEPVSGQRMGTEVMIPSIPPGRLIIKEWAMPEKKYEINQMVIAIGTSDDNDIVLKDNAVSRHHAKIRVEGKKYFIYDMASTNGTRVNGRKITKKWIKEGDTIEVGRTMMIFKTEAPPSEIPEHKPSDLLKM